MFVTLVLVLSMNLVRAAFLANAASSCFNLSLSVFSFLFRGVEMGHS